MHANGSLTRSYTESGPRVVVALRIVPIFGYAKGPSFDGFRIQSKTLGSLTTGLSIGIFL